MLTDDSNHGIILSLYEVDMSGGEFDYKQSRIKEIAEELEEIIKNEEASPSYRIETLSEFKIGLEYLKLAYIYTQRIDWLISCDDGEDTFHDRLDQELKEGKYYE